MRYKLGDKAINDREVLVGTPIFSVAQELYVEDYNGWGSLQIADQVSVGGAGTLKIEILVSNDGENYSIPKDKTGAEKDNVVVDAHADGEGFYQFPEIPIANFYKYKLTAIDANITSVTVFQAMK